jgi:Rps23 Pro-64 3,4-dihydroxylase Tpa1-like proline 4-hydroxylase
MPPNLQTLPPSKDEFIALIGDSLLSRQDEIMAAFAASSAAVGVRYAVIDDLLPAHVAAMIEEAFPDGHAMRLMDSFRERKFTSKAFDRFDPILSDVTFAFQDRRIVEIVERVTGIAGQMPDPLLYAGGLSAMGKGHFLGPHIDNSHDASRQFYRTLNLLYYVSQDWDEANGGNLQLWNRDLSANLTIHSRFNRLVLMETTPWSWHSVNHVKVDGLRKCVSNYYFSKSSPTGEDYFNITAFSAPQSQWLLRLRSRVDAGLRQLVRKIRPDGPGPMDVYEGPPR